MLKEDITDLKIDHLIGSGSSSLVFLLKDGSVFKKFFPYVNKRYGDIGISLEEKILYADNLKGNNEFMFPISAVYENNEFVGYTMENIKDINFNQYDETVSQRDFCSIDFYNNNYQKIENIIKKGHKLGLVFPDLCSADNIYVSKDGNFRFGDYDGFQVDKYKSVNISSSLGDVESFFSDKFFQNDRFTFELDKYSLMVLYFLDTFKIVVNPEKFDYNADVFHTLKTIGINDIKILNMIYDTMSTNRNGVYVSEFSYELAKHYDLEYVNEGYKRLVKKQ